MCVCIVIIAIVAETAITAITAIITVVNFCKHFLIANIFPSRSHFRKYFPAQNNSSLQYIQRTCYSERLVSGQLPTTVYTQ